MKWKCKCGEINDGMSPNSYATHCKKCHKYWAVSLDEWIELARPTNEPIEEKLKRIIYETQDALDLRLELLSAAFLQETGLKPSQCELVQEHRSKTGEIVFYYRKREQ